MKILTDRWGGKYSGTVQTVWNVGESGDESGQFHGSPHFIRGPSHALLSPSSLDPTVLRSSLHLGHRSPPPLAQGADAAVREARAS